MYSICINWQHQCRGRKRNPDNKVWTKRRGAHHDFLILVNIFTTTESERIFMFFNYYSYSCGYRKAFEDYVNILSEKYPQITVTGGNYDPPGMNMYFSKLIFAVKILLIVVIVSSFDIFGAIGQATPSWWRHLLDNKLYACMMIFFVGNMLEGQVSVGY